MRNSELYTCLIEERTKEEAFIQVYWSHADHIGAAIEKMVAAARLNGLTNPEPRQIDPYCIENLKSQIEPSSDSETFWARERIYFKPEPLFLLPYGVIGSCIDGDYDMDEVVAGYSRHKDVEGKTTIEVNVEREELLSLYARLLKLRQTYRVFWYLIHGHWEDSEDQFLVNENLTTPEAILGHLAESRFDSFLNGYVTLTACLKEGATNLNISDHKRIIILTYSDAIADEYSSALEDAGYGLVDGLVSIERGIHHWHHRHPEARDRSELMEHLRSIGFSDWRPKQ